MSKVLVVAAHPDDEVLGIAGTVMKHIEEGDEVRCLIAATGMAAREDDKDKIKRLHAKTLEAAKIIGYRDVKFLDFPDNKMDSLPLLDIIQPIEKVIDDFMPDVIYTHFENDLNIDHRLCYQAIITACRPIGGYAPKIYTFEVLSSTEWQRSTAGTFVPTTYVDIEKYMDRKLKALLVYDTEVREYPFPRCPEGLNILAGYRGLESGLKFAEALQLVREIR